MSNDMHVNIQGKFYKQTAENCLDALSEMFNALPSKKRIDFIGHLNEISLVLERGKREWPVAEEKTSNV